MAVVGSLNVLLGANVSEFAAQMDKSAKKVESTAEQMRNSWIGTLKMSVGEDSMFGGTMKALKGAGAVAGFALAAQAVQKIGEASAKLREQWESNTMTAGEMADNLARSVPILGNLYAAGRAFREALTGANALAKQSLENEMRMAKVFETRLQKIREIHDFVRNANADNEALAQSIELGGLEGSMRDAKAAAFELQNGLAKVAKEQERIGLLGQQSGVKVDKAMAELQERMSLLYRQYQQTLGNVAQSFGDDMMAAAAHIREAFDEWVKGAVAAAAATKLTEKALGEIVSKVGEVAKAGKESIQPSLDALEEWQRKAEDVFESTRTPLEKYEKTIGELGDLLNRGLIDWETYGRAIRDAREELEGVAEVAESQFASLEDTGQLAGLAAQEASRLAMAQPAASSTAMAQGAMAAGAAMGNSLPSNNERKPQEDMIREIRDDIRVLRSKVEVG